MTTMLLFAARHMPDATSHSYAEDQSRCCHPSLAVVATVIITNIDVVIATTLLGLVRVSGTAAAKKSIAKGTAQLCSFTALLSLMPRKVAWG